MSNFNPAAIGGNNRHYERLYAEYKDSEYGGRSGRGAKKRKGYLPWEKFFMSVAFFVFAEKQRSSYEGKLRHESVYSSKY